MRAIAQVLIVVMMAGCLPANTPAPSTPEHEDAEVPPDGNVVALASPGPAQDRPWPSEGPPRPLPARDVNFPPYEVRTFENGLQVMAVLHHEQPVVSIRMVIRAGAAHDPRGKAGLAHLAASLLDQGTTTKSAGPSGVV